MVYAINGVLNFSDFQPIALPPYPCRVSAAPAAPLP